MNFSSTISSPARILVVDDHPHTAELLARTLSQLSTHVTVISATSGPQALECAQQLPVHVLITDLNMPGMTGLELIEEFQKRPVGGPAFSFLLTASHVPGLKIEARRLHVREVLYKPIHPQKISKLVEQALQEIESYGSYKELEMQKASFKILIADEESDHVTALSRLVEGEGYAYIAATNGREALEQIGTQRPDLILLDVHMPGKDGMSFLQEIRTDPATQHIPVILLSAVWNSMVELREDWQLDPQDFFSKPIRRRELLARIRAKLQRRMKEAQQTSMVREQD